MSYADSRWIRIENNWKMELHAIVMNRMELDFLLFELRTLQQFLPPGEDDADRIALAAAPFPAKR